MNKIIVKQSLDIDVEEVFERTMISYSCELFALLVSSAVKKHDDPDRLKKCILHELERITTAST